MSQMWLTKNDHVEYNAVVLHIIHVGHTIGENSLSDKSIT